MMEIMPMILMDSMNRSSLMYLNSYEMNSLIDYDDENTIFKMQMYYMLLWSAIDRYCSLKYDVSNTQADYLKNLSDDEVFIQAFYSIKPDSRDPVRSANNASTFYFNRAKAKFCSKLLLYDTFKCCSQGKGSQK